MLRCLGVSAFIVHLALSESERSLLNSRLQAAEGSCGGSSSKGYRCTGGKELSHDTDLTEDECCQTCKSNKKCGAWSRKSNGKCFTYDECGETEDQDGTVTGNTGPSPTPSPSPSPTPSPTPTPSPSPSPKGGAVVGFAGKGFNGWKHYDWNTLTHVAFWSKPDSDVREKAKSHGVKLFKDHGTGCSLDCYTSDSDKKKAVKKILDTVDKDDLDGVFFDEERSGLQMSKKQKDGYADFVKRAADALRPLGKSVFVCVAGRPSYEFRSYDYGPMAEASEFLFVMGYDMHFWDDYSCVLSGECSPAEAPYPDIKDGVKQYLKQVAGSKLVLGLPWYGQRYTYVGPIPFNEGQVDYKDVLRYQDKTKIKNLKLVDNDKSWKLVCKGACDPDGHKGGVVWFDDAETLAPKYQLARDNGLLGVGVWKIDSAPYDGSHDKERDAMWKALAKWNVADAELV